DGQPALLTSENTSQRRALERWFRVEGIAPVVVAEFEDPALMKVMAEDGLGFIPVPTVVIPEAIERYGFEQIGEAPGCIDQYYAITAERKIHHPAVALLTANAQKRLVGAAG